jgi:hypothetical protein
MTIEELKKEMQNGVVEFQFIKKDGSIRNAKGTTNMGIIPEENHPTGTDKPLSDNVVRFYDVEKSEWRSFCIANYIENPAIE